MLKDRYVEFGPGRRLHARVGGEGYTLVFFPDNGCTAADFEPVMQRLAGRFQVVGLDLPGRDQTQWPDVTFNFQTDLYPVVDWALSQLDIGPHVAVGHGVGGLFALMHAYRHRGRVIGVSLIESYLCEEARRQTVCRSRHRPVRFASDQLVAFQKRRMRQALWLNANATFRESFLSSQKDADPRLLIRDLEIPIQVFVADGGQLLPGETDIASWRYQLQMTGVEDLQIVRVPESGHWLMLDDPDRVADQLSGFVQQILAYGR